VEPLVQGASGMRMYRQSFLEKVMQKIKAHDILIIFDEVMTGFGRTGTFFALDQIAEKPDIVCLSKGLTAGFMPLALTVCSEEVYQMFLSSNWDMALKHGHSYTANPLACAVALASLQLFAQEQTMDKIKNIADFYHHNMHRLLDNDFLYRPRMLGSIFAIDFLNNPNDFTLEKRQKIERRCLEQGVFLRPLGNTFYLLPPYCATQAELNQVFDIFLQLEKFTIDKNR
jgi:adenosylmethionine-8-amino-7-oxononanoate aminotransferase